MRKNYLKSVVMSKEDKDILNKKLNDIEIYSFEYEINEDDPEFVENLLGSGIEFPKDLYNYIKENLHKKLIYIGVQIKGNNNGQEVFMPIISQMSGYLYYSPFYDIITGTATTGYISTGSASDTFGHDCSSIVLYRDTDKYYMKIIFK